MLAEIATTTVQSSTSSATIDCLLATERKRLKFKGRTGTKPDRLLKKVILIKAFTDWDDNRPDFIEIDLVAYKGGNPRGDFNQDSKGS